MLSNRGIKAPLLWCLLACLMLTGVVWLLGHRLLSGIELAPDQGASWYYWKLQRPTVWTHLSAWLGYVAHQLTVWGLMFLFGFLAIFVITQMHGVGLSRRTRVVLGAIYLVAVLGVYSWRGWNHLFEVTWIPIIEYSLVAVIAGLVWIALKIADAVRSRSGSDSPDLRSPTTTGHRA